MVLRSRKISLLDVADLGLIVFTKVRAEPAEMDGSWVAEVTVGTRGCLCVALLSGNYVNNNTGEL